MKKRISTISLSIICFLFGFFVVGSFIHKESLNEETENQKNKLQKIARENAVSFQNFKAYQNGGMNCPSHPIYELADSIINKGSREAETELLIYYFDIGTEKFFPWTLLIANKFDRDQSLIVYFSFCGLSNNTDMLIVDNSCYSLDNLDVRTRRMAIEYLKIAADNGEEEAKDILAYYAKQNKYINE